MDAAEQLVRRHDILPKVEGATIRDIPRGPRNPARRAQFHHPVQRKREPVSEQARAIWCRKNNSLHLRWGPHMCGRHSPLADTATDLQTMTELAWLESTKERFEYSTSKSKAMVFTKKQEPVNPGLLMNNQVVELSTKETHLGIVRTNDNRANEAVQERIKTTYALLGTGIYGINCLHPKVSLRILETYVQPTLGYGFETLNLTASNTQELEAFMRGLLRRIQLLPQESASCANHILLGTLPMEAFLDSQVLGLFGRTLRLENAKEKELIWRQLALKDSDSSSWTQKVRKILDKYSLLSAYDLLALPPNKEEWKIETRRSIRSYWTEKTLKEAEGKSTLKWLNKTSYNPGTLHPVWENVESNPLDIKRGQIKARILTGRYTLNADLARFKKSDPTLQQRGRDHSTFHARMRPPRGQQKRVPKAPMQSLI